MKTRPTKISPRPKISTSPMPPMLAPLPYGGCHSVARHHIARHDARGEHRCPSAPPADVGTECLGGPGERGAGVGLILLNSR